MYCYSKKNSSSVFSSKIYHLLQFFILCLMTSICGAAELYSKPDLSKATHLNMDATFSPSFDTAGITLKPPANLIGANIHLEYKEASETEYRTAHPFTQYDAQHAATSLFGLTPATTYQTRVSIINGNTAYFDEFTFSTRAPFTIPTPTTTTTVNSTSELVLAIASAVPGEHIVLNPGTYSAFEIRDRQFDPTQPLVIRGHYNLERPHIQGPGTGSTPAIFIKNSANIIFDYIEVSEGGSHSEGINVYIKASSTITVQNSIIREGGRYNVLIAKSNEYSGGIRNAGKHLIQNNHIFDSEYQNCTGSLIRYCENRTRFGVVSQNFGGGELIIRNNHIHGHYDNVSACSESDNTGISNHANLFAFTGSSTPFNGHDIEVTGNTIYDASDDNIELDGICSNVRVVNNDLGETANHISIAPALPGPFFIINNHASGELRQSTIKMNTSAGSASEPTRNVYIYNNSFVRNNPGSLINLHFDHNEHRVPIHNINFIDNLFVSPNGGIAMKAINGGENSEHPDFDYNLWYTAEPSPGYNWNGGEFYDFSAFQAQTGQEAHGIFAEVCVYEDGLTMNSNSPAKNTGIIIPNINNNTGDTTPNIGAL